MTGMLRSAACRLRSLRRIMCRFHVKLLRSVHGVKPIPLRYWSFYHRLITIFIPEPDLLFPSYEWLRSSGTSLRIEELKSLLMNDVLGEWALDAQTINFIWEMLQRTRPRLIVECGAGISTLVLARYAALASSSEMPCRVISLEQDFNTAQSIRWRLSKVGLESLAEIVHSPLDANGNYSLDNFKQVLARLPRRFIDFLMIDGPAGEIGCRMGTLPMLVNHCSDGAKWFLDDAFRDGEMKILGHWSRLDGVAVEGIYPMGKGLGTGFIQH